MGGAQPGLGGAAQTGAGAGRGLPAGPAGGTGGRQGGAPVGGAFGAGGGIVGVASKSTEKCSAYTTDAAPYNEWAFVAVQRQLQAGAEPAADRPPRGADAAAVRESAAPGPDPASTALPADQARSGRPRAMAAASGRPPGR